MRQFRRTHFAASLVVCAIYIAARLWGLTSSCLWFDEIFSVHAAEHDWASLWSFVALDLIHPPLFYALLKLWIGIDGEGLLWLRLLPVLFAVVAIFPFISLCHELKISPWTRVLALFLLAVNGSLIKYSQEVRMYSLLMCLSLFSMWLFARYFQKGKSLIVLTIVNVVLVWTHYFGWFVVASEVAAVLVFQRIKWRPMLAMCGVAVGAFIPWSIAVAMAVGNGSGLSQNIGWMARPGLLAVTQLKLTLIEPFYFQASNVDSVSIYRVSVPLILIVAAAVIAFLLRWTKHGPADNRAFQLMVCFAALPLIAAFAVSWLLPYSIWGTRHLIIVFAPASLLIALALSKMPARALRIAAVTLALLFVGYAFAVKARSPTPEYIWCSWGQLTDKLEPGTDVHIYATEDAIAYHLWFAARNRENTRVTKLETGAPEDAAYFVPRGFTDVDRIGFDGIKEDDPWLAYRDSRVGGELSLISRLAQLGFVVDKEFSVDSQNTRAFLIKLRRQ